MKFSKLVAAAHAASSLSPSALLGHVRRRVRNKVVPRRASAYRAGLARRAEGFSHFVRRPEAVELARLVADCFGAEYAATIPGCFDANFEILNASLHFGSAARVDWRSTTDEGNRQVRRANLSQMGFLAPAMLADPDRTVVLAGPLIDSFLASADFTRGRDFVELWHPYIASRRILALSSARLLMPERLNDRVEVQTLDRFIKMNAAFVLRNLETELGYNHLERNLAALGLFGLSCDSFPEEIRQAILSNYQAIVVDSIEDDGVQKERSAMYQGLTVQSLRIFSALPIWSAEQRTMISWRLAAAEDALASLTLGDDLPVLFNDGWLGEAPPTSAVVGLVRPGFRALRDAGYVRLADENWIVVMDAGPIGPEENAGHGHPDFLSIEASFGVHRLFVDPGTYNYSSGSLRDTLRAWTAHNGPAFLGPEPVVFVDEFKVGRRAAAKLLSAEETPGLQTACGALGFDGLELRRSVSLTGDGTLTIEDSWSSKSFPRQTRFLVPSDWAIEQTAGGLLLRRDAVALALKVEGAAVALSVGVWARYYSVEEKAHEIILRPDDQADGLTIVISAVDH